MMYINWYEAYFISSRGSAVKINTTSIQYCSNFMMKTYSHSSNSIQFNLISAATLCIHFFN